MVWIRTRNSALAGLAPLVGVCPCGIHIETITQTDVMPFHTRVEDPLCPRGLHQLAVVTAVHTAATSLYESASGAPFLQLHHLSFPSAVMSSRSNTGEQQPQRGSTMLPSTRLQEQEQDEPVPRVQAQAGSSFSATSMNVDENVGFVT